MEVGGPQPSLFTKLALPRPTLHVPYVLYKHLCLGLQLVHPAALVSVGKKQQSGWHPLQEHLLPQGAAWLERPQ